MAISQTIEKIKAVYPNSWKKSEKRMRAEGFGPSDDEKGEKKNKS